MLAHPQPLAGQAEVGVPLEAAVAPVAVPRRRLLRVAEELDLHLLELARAEGEVARRDLIAEALADLGDPEGDADPRGVNDILEVDEDALRRLRPQERRVLIGTECPDNRLEHQVELARRSQRAEVLRVRPEHQFKAPDRRETLHRAIPFQLVGVLGAEVEELQRPLLDLLHRLVAVPVIGDEDVLPLRLDPAAEYLVVAVAFLRLAAVNHVVVKQVIVAGAFPDLWMHDDGAVEADHLVRAGGAGRRAEFIVAGDHVAPPDLLDIALQLDAERAVVPEPVQPTVDLASLEEKPAPLAQRDDLVHLLVFGHSLHPYRSPTRQRGVTYPSLARRAGVVSLRPVTLGDADGADLDAQRIGPQLRHQGELIDLRRCLDVLLEAEPLEVAAAVTQLQCSLQTAAVRVEAVPGKPSAVVEANRPLVVEEIDQGTGQQRVLERDVAVGAGADDMNRTRLVSQLFAHGTVVDERGDERTSGDDTAQQGAGAVGRGQHQGDAAAGPWREAARRIAQVEAGDRQSAALAGKQDTTGPHRVGQCPRLVHLGTGKHRGTARGEGVDNRGRGPQHVDDHRHALAQPFRRRQLGQQIDVNVPLLGHDSTPHDPRKTSSYLMQEP